MDLVRQYVNGILLGAGIITASAILAHFHLAIIVFSK